MANKICLKYPVVLVHGIAAHDRVKKFSFWGRIPKTLEENGVKVFFGNTDSWGSCDSNAKILKNTIDKILLETKSEKVNIIAHSKGGIDSRYFIWKYGGADKTASLSTVSTPHNGSELADLLFRQNIVHSRAVRKVLKIFGRLWGDVNPDLYNVNYQLTSGKMKEFNKNICMDEKVYYQSLYTTMRNSFDDLLFLYSHLYLKKVSGENDGIVSERSAQWGNNFRKIGDRISHGEIVDLKIRRISGVNIPNIYLNVIEDLGKRGF